MKKERKDMNKRIKHIWNYLTSPTYRFWVDFCSAQENLDRNMNLIEDNLRLKTYPMFFVKNDKLNMTTKPNNEWEKKFDKKFGDKEGCQNNGENCGEKVQPSGDFLCSICEKWGGVEGVIKDWKKPLGTFKQIKSFISSLLSSERQRLREEIEKMKIKRRETGWLDSQVPVYNQALSDVLKLLE